MRHQETNYYRDDMVTMTLSPLRGLCVWLLAVTAMAYLGSALGDPLPFVNLVVSCEATVQGGPGGGG